MTVTGERVVTAEGGFNPTYQRHVATYALCEPFLPPGRVLDVGAGTGHSHHLLAPRETVGLDLDADALAGQDRETVVADMRELPFPAGSFASVLAVQSIEHVPDGERVLAEAARVLEQTGVAVFVTPNRLTFAHPDEIIDPYHYVEYDPAELRALCRTAFETVELRGIFGSPRFDALTAEERERLDSLLRADRLRLRRIVPRHMRQRLYDLMLTRARRRPDPGAAAIRPDDFELRADGLDGAFDLVAVCRRPSDPSA
jgi:SAM-dependent methyltransferase